MAVDSEAGGSTPVAHAHKLDCEAAATNCRFIVQSEDEAEVIERTKRHMQDVHG